jgi:phosphoglycolate phosphatase
MPELSVLDGATIAFDLDGTLVDSAPDLVGTLNLILTQEGLPLLPFDTARSFIGHGARRMLEQGFAAQGLTPTADQMDGLFARFLAHYEQHSTDLTRPFPGVAEALAELKARGARLTVCTNKITPLSRPILEALDLARYFDAIVGADLSPARKPDPRHLATAVELACGRLDRTIMVGDAAPDAGCAKACGAPLVLVSFGYTDIPVTELGADILIDHYDQLIEACETLLTACEPRTTGL